MDAYSRIEKIAMARWQEWRDKRLCAVTDLMAWVGINANDLTVVGICFGLLGAALIWISPEFGLSLILAHLVIDGIDGPLARATKTQSAFGSALDSIGDALVAGAIAVGAAVFGQHSSSALPVSAAYATLYAASVIACLIATHRRGRIPLMFRPRWVILGAVVGEAIFGLVCANITVAYVTAFLSVQGVMVMAWLCCAAWLSARRRPRK